MAFPLQQRCITGLKAFPEVGFYYSGGAERGRDGLSVAFADKLGFCLTEMTIMSLVFVEHNGFSGPKYLLEKIYNVSLIQ